MNHEIFKLPICEKPIILNNFPAIQFSVLQSSKFDIMPVIINGYTNIVMGKDLRLRYIHLRNEDWPLEDKIMHRQHMTYHKEMFESNKNNLLEMILLFVSNGYYLSGNYNAFYISAKHAYQAYNTNTVYLIYGYNRNERLFFAIGKTKYNNFEPYTIPFNEYFLGVSNRMDNYVNFNFIKFNEGCNPKINYSKIYNGIYDYLNSKNKDDGLIPEGDAINYRYGLNCYRNFFAMLSSMYEYQNYIEPLSYSILLEHHIIMKKRIEYLMESGALTDSSIAIEYDSICKKANEVYVGCLEYNNSFEPELLSRIYITVNQIINDENQILNRLLFQIKQFINTKTSK